MFGPFTALRWRTKLFEISWAIRDIGEPGQIYRLHSVWEAVGMLDKSLH